MSRNLGALADELPEPLPTLVRAALEADEPYEHAHKIAVATEMLTKWLVAVNVSRLDAWPRLLRRQFHSGLDELRPTFGTWLRWAEASRAFTEDEVARKALREAKDSRDSWAHFYQEVPNALRPNELGSALWWERLLSGPCVGALRSGCVDRIAPWPTWSANGTVSSLEPWVHLHDSRLLLLHHVSWESGRGAYVSYFGAPVAFPLSERFRLERPRSGVSEPLKFTQSGHAVATALSDRRVKWIILVGSARDGTGVFARAAAERDDVEVRSVASVSEVPTTVGELNYSTKRRRLLVASSGDVVDAICGIVDKPRVLKLRAPTAVDILTSISRALTSIQLDSALATAAVDALEGDAEALSGFLAALGRRPPTDARQFRQLLETHPEHHRATPQTTSPARPATLGVSTELTWSHLDRLLYDEGLTKDHEGYEGPPLHERVREHGLTLARRVPQEVVRPEWGYWLRRWMPEATFAAVAAARALYEWRTGAKHDAVHWVSQIRRGRDSATGQHDPITGVFVAAVVRELVDDGVPHTAVEEAIRSLPIDALAWLRTASTAAVPDELLFECAVARFDRDRATGREHVVRAVLAAEETGWKLDFAGFIAHPLGHSAAAINRHDDAWLESFSRWARSLQWRDSLRWESWSLEPKRLAVPPRVGDLVRESNAAVAAKTAISGILQYGPDSEWRSAADSLISSIQDPYWRAERLRDLAVALLHAGDFDEATSITYRIDYPRFRVESLLSLAKWTDDPDRASRLLDEASSLVSSLDRSQIRREYWPKVLDASLSVASPREDDVLSALAHLEEEGSVDTVTSAWEAVARHGRSPGRARRIAELRRALLPGVIEPSQERAPSEPGVGIPATHNARRTLLLSPPCSIEVAPDEWASLRHGLAIEATIHPSRMADFAGIVSAEVGYQTASYFGLRLGGDHARFTVETSHGVFEAVSSDPLARLEPEQPPYRLLGVFDGREVSLFVDGVLRASCPAGGLVRLREGAISVGEQQPGFRRLDGLVHQVRLWGLESNAWTLLIAARRA